MAYQPPQGPYGYQGQYGGLAGEHPQGVTILVVGILSLVLCSLLGPVAWVMGTNALHEIDQNPAAYSNRGVVLAGQICGIIATVLLGLGLLMLVLLLAAAS